MAAVGAFRACAKRSFSAAAKPSLVQRLFFEVPTQNPLNEEFPGVPASTGAKGSAAEAQVSKLANGLTFASVDMGGATASVGVYVKAGSRYEPLPGMSHLLESLAFASTQKRSTLKLQRDVENLGGTVSARTGREVFTYSGSALRGSLDGLVSILGEAVTQPAMLPWEVKEAAEELSHTAEEQASDARVALLEGLHAAAFGQSSPLGRSVFASPSDLEGVSGKAMRAFLGARFAANKMVLTATNVEHNAFADALDKYFVGLPEGVAEVAAGAPAFVGGETMIRTDGSGLAHVAVGLAAPSLGAGPAQVHALGVLQALLGSTGAHGGGAGAARLGPQGHSRIARSIHNDAHSFIHSLAAFALPYSDAGLLGVAGAAADHEAGRLVDVMVGFVKDAAALPISDAELARAKATYKLRLAAGAETAEGARDDLGAQLLLAGKRTALGETLKAVDAVSAAQVQAVAKAALASKPAIASIGSLATMPRYDVFASLLK